MKNIHSTCYASLSEAVKNAFNTTHVSPWVVFFHSPEKVSGSIYSRDSITKIFSIKEDQLLSIECFECDPLDSAVYRPFSKQMAIDIKNFIEPFWVSKGDLVVTCPIGKISASVVAGMQNASVSTHSINYGKNFIIKRIQNLVISES